MHQIGYKSRRIKTILVKDSNPLQMRLGVDMEIDLSVITTDSLLLIVDVFFLFWRDVAWIDIHIDCSLLYVHHL